MPLWMPGEVPHPNAYRLIRRKCINDMSDTKITATGLYNIPDKGPVLILPNHRSEKWDVKAMANVLPRQVWNMGKIELKEGIEGWMMGLAGVIFVDRSNIKSRGEAAIKARTQLESGKAFMLFPEGTSRMEGDRAKVEKIESGAASLAVSTGATIIFVGIHGTDTPDQPKHVHITVSEPYRVDRIEGRSERKVAAEILHPIIIERMQAMLDYASVQAAYAL